MAVNWGLGLSNGAQNAFQTGFQIGDTLRQRNDMAQQRNLMMQQQQAKAQQEQVERRRADIPFVGRLLDSVTDEASYQRARGVAQQYGIDLSGAPSSYDPSWVDQQKTTVQALSTPQGQAALSTAGKIAQDEGLRPGTPEFGARVTQIWKAENQKTIPYTAGGGVASVDPTTGGVSTLIAPNNVGAPTGSPVPQGNIPRLTNPSEVEKLPPGSQFYDPNFILRQAPGGASSNAGGGFR